MSDPIESWSGDGTQKPPLMIYDPIENRKKMREAFIFGINVMTLIYIAVMLFFSIFFGDRSLRRRVTDLEFHQTVQLTNQFKLYENQSNLVDGCSNLEALVKIISMGVNTNAIEMIQFEMRTEQRLEKLESRRARPSLDEFKQTDASAMRPYHRPYPL